MDFFQTLKLNAAKTAQYWKNVYYKLVLLLNLASSVLVLRGQHCQVVKINEL
jgi:hypothetical protein